ncbi:MAG: hypothetical protein KatS3mg087_1402 [Patescibacteria group bacterium]|nr:MAG: hypothetical protein KatS3mg087_1402 [Patescibacteria group bacterium]
MFIGEAPGQLEDALGLPFVGSAGRVLETTLELCHMNFHYCITNTVCCRPCTIYYLDDSLENKDLSELVPGEDYTIEDYNREPTRKEIEACKPHIEELIESYGPDGVIYLGKVAKTLDLPLPSLELLHPAAILRQEYKLVTVKKEARKIDKFVKVLFTRKNK